jgi:hypothetical protein
MPISGRSRAPAAFEQRKLYQRLRSAALAGYVARRAATLRVNIAIAEFHRITGEMLPRVPLCIR